MAHILLGAALLCLSYGGAGGDSFSFTLFKGEGATNEALASLRKTRHNLNGQPGEGYYLPMVIGTPPQNVST